MRANFASFSGMPKPHFVALALVSVQNAWNAMFGLIPQVFAD